VDLICSPLLSGLPRKELDEISGAMPEIEEAGRDGPTSARLALEEGMNVFVRKLIVQ